jgi:hypothetical protein
MKKQELQRYILSSLIYQRFLKMEIKIVKTQMIKKHSMYIKKIFLLLFSDKNKSLKMIVMPNRNLD